MPHLVFASSLGDSGDFDLVTQLVTLLGSRLSALTEHRTFEMTSRHFNGVHALGPNDEEAMEEQVNRGMGQATTSGRGRAGKRKSVYQRAGEGKGDRGERTAHEEAVAMAQANRDCLGEETLVNYKGQWGTFVKYVKLFGIKGENWTGVGTAGSGDELTISTASRFWEELKDDHNYAMAHGIAVKDENEKKKKAVYRYRVLVSIWEGWTNFEMHHNHMSMQHPHYNNPHCMIYSIPQTKSWMDTMHATITGQYTLMTRRL